MHLTAFSYSLTLSTSYISLHVYPYSLTFSSTPQFTMLSFVQSKADRKKKGGGKCVTPIFQVGRESSWGWERITKNRLVWFFVCFPFQKKRPLETHSYIFFSIFWLSLRFFSLSPPYFLFVYFSSLYIIMCLTSCRCTCVCFLTMLLLFLHM